MVRALKFLTKSVRSEIDRAPVLSRRWRYIVVHNSGTRQGNAKAFDYYHLHVRKMPNGLAYHFVIGNGTSTGDGEIEIGNRWKRQINGGHVHSDYLNNIALGICLVGDFNRDTPTKNNSMPATNSSATCGSAVGKIDRKWAIVKPHREINPPRWPTDCPGDRFPYNWIHGRFDQPGTCTKRQNIEHPTSNAEHPMVPTLTGAAVPLSLGVGCSVLEVGCSSA